MTTTPLIHNSIHLITFRPVLIICVTSYFVLMGILTIYTTYIEKGIFAVAIQSDSNGNTIKKWTASSDMKKYDDKYMLTLSVKDSKNVREVSTTKSCANFIDVDGIICQDLISAELKRLHNSLSSEKKDK
jgi:signal peptidase complex subunit 2